MRRDFGYLLDILDSAELILDYIGSKSIDEFMEDTQLQDSVAWRYQVIGEATSRVSESTRTQHPEIPWSDMRGMRNFLVHRYHRINMKVLWQTASDKLPRLIEQLREIVPTKPD